MRYFLKNIIFRNAVLLILSCCVFERTGISLVSQVISSIYEHQNDLLLTDIEDETKENETNKGSSLREFWTDISDFPLPEPVILTGLLTGNMHDSKYYGAFYPSVPTPPPNPAV